MNNEISKEDAKNGLLPDNMVLVGDTPVKFDRDFVARCMNVPNISNENMTRLLTQCYQKNLHPINDIYVVAYAGKFDMIEKVENKQKRALATGKIKGFKSGIAVMLPKGELVVRENAFLLMNEKLIGAWAEIDTTHMGVVRKEVNFSEYNTGKSTWSKMPVTMIMKVARGQLMDLVFPELFGGLYTPEEMEKVIEEETQFNPDDIQAPTIDPVVALNEEEVIEVEVEDVIEAEIEEIIETNPEVIKAELTEMLDNSPVGKLLF